MNITDNIVQNCMLWLTDLSTYRYRIQKMQVHLQNIKTQFSLLGKFEQYVNLSRDLQTALKKLKAVEAKVIHTIKMHQNELYVPALNKLLDLQNENELFDNMIYANKITVELQRSVGNCFKQYET
ncbi:MAG: hypothetical protein LH478_01475, partial [Chitinophagaceae bacterium]|nr:hypothetical protein [Chitinophagaceae bacterium]